MTRKELFIRGFHRVLGAQVALQKANAECSRACAELGDAWREWFEQFEPMLGKIDQVLAQEAEEEEPAEPWLIQRDALGNIVAPKLGREGGEG